MHFSPSCLSAVTYELLHGENRISTGPSGRRRLVVVVDQLLELLARLEVGDLLGGYVHARTGLRVAALPRPALSDAEAAEPAQLDLLVPVKSLDHRLEDRIDDHLGVLLRQLG